MHPATLSSAGQDRHPSFDGTDAAAVDITLAVDHSRRNALTSDTNIALILAGRTRKKSVELPIIVKPRHRVIDRVYIESDKDFRHLLGEVTSDKFNIHGRPEFDLIEVSYKLPLPDGEYDLQPIVRLLFYCSQSVFVISEKVEDRLLYKLRVMQDGNELIVCSSVCTFGTDGRHHEYSTLDRARTKLWRRFLREFISPLLDDTDRMKALDMRLRKNLVFIEEPLSDDDSSTTASVKPIPKKKGNRKPASRGGNQQQKLPKRGQLLNTVEGDSSDDEGADQKKIASSAAEFKRVRPGSGGKRTAGSAGRSSGGGGVGSSRPQSPSQQMKSRPGSASRPASANVPKNSS